VAKLPTPVIVTSPSGGSVASVSGIVQTPNPGIVQVKYSRLVPETMQGSLDDPQIRQLLMLGTQLAENNEVHAQSVSLMADECRTTHGCSSNAEGASVLRTALLTELRYDTNPAVRMKALNGLQAISLLQPVQADSSVRQVLRTVSSQDVNPAIRNASFHVLQGAADIE